jgi:hypothetical protein
MDTRVFGMIAFEAEGGVVSMPIGEGREGRVAALVERKIAALHSQFHEGGGEGGDEPDEDVAEAIREALVMSGEILETRLALSRLKFMEEMRRVRLGTRGAASGVMGLSTATAAAAKSAFAARAREAEEEDALSDHAATVAVLAPMLAEMGGGGETCPVLWLVQTNMGSASDIAAWTDALDAEGIPWQGVEVAPFSGEVPEVDWVGPVVCYGSTSFVVACKESGRFLPGVWHDDERFSYGAWAENLGAMLLNSPDATRRTTIGEYAAAAVSDPGEPVFARPERDLKEFNGAVWAAGELRDWCAKIAAGGFEPLGPDTPMVVGTPFGIAEEWRLFVVDGEVVAASSYRRGGKLDKREGAPPEVLEFAAEAIACWQPAPVFTLDVCRSGDGLFVVEAQGFNSAGHYACDLRAVVRAVSARAAVDWLGAFFHGEEE